jgi:DNA-binding CsgD family transcriptional regulator
VVIEPAKGGDVAPLIVEAYGLTQRELDVTRAIARGLGTAEMASHLFISQHTVRDHVKSVFEKVGVSSRGELGGEGLRRPLLAGPHRDVALTGSLADPRGRHASSASCLRSTFLSNLPDARLRDLVDERELVGIHHFATRPTGARTGPRADVRPLLADDARSGPLLPCSSASRSRPPRRRSRAP